MLINSYDDIEDEVCSCKVFLLLEWYALLVVSSRWLLKWWCLDLPKARQTKFTVYRHRLFDFACGQVAIIQISN